MEFYLIKDWDLKMNPGDDGVSVKELRRDTKRIEIQVEPVVPSIRTDGKGFSEWFVDSLVENHVSVKNILNPPQLSRFLRLRIDYPASDTDTGSITIFGAEYDEHLDYCGTSIFQRLSRLYEPRHVQVNIKLTDFKCLEGNSTDAGFEFEGKAKCLDMNLKRNAYDGKNCHFKGVDFPFNLQDQWLDGKDFSGKVTLSVRVSHDVVSKLYLQDFIPSDLPGDGKRALVEGICTDLEIVAANGARVKCHKVYLAVKSDVFKAMFQNKMKEATTNSIEMRDMSEAGVRAFLAFIYHWGLKEASKSCDIAFELYQAGHKYDISDLEQAMELLIICKPNDWFSPDMAVKLFVFANNLNVGDEDELIYTLKRAVQVLKWYTDKFYDKLKDSLEYQQLFRKNPKAAMNLVAYFSKVT